MDRAVPRCASLIHSCQNAGATACALARVFCTARILDYFPLKERNIYDIRGECKKPPLCYDFDNVEAFLKRPEVLAVRACSGGGMWMGSREGKTIPSVLCVSTGSQYRADIHSYMYTQQALHVAPEAGPWKTCSDQVMLNFLPDVMKNYHTLLVPLLEGGVKVRLRLRFG